MSSAAPLAALSAVGSLLAGYVLAKLFVAATACIRDAASGTILQFVGTFGVWMLAENAGLSAIITMVVYAMTLARLAPRRIAARNRISSYSVWETAVFVLNVLAFVLMGLQARPILERLSEQSRFDAFLLAFVVLVTVIVVRFVWVLGVGAIARPRRPPRLPARAEPSDREGFRGELLIGWCGMRGLVTLATAFALPADFPGRDPIVLAAFCVVFGTLVLQGLTLKPLMRRLRLEPDTSVEQEVSEARVAIMQAALDSLAAEMSSSRRSRPPAIFGGARVAESVEAPQRATEYDELRLRAIKSQRKVLERLRNEGRSATRPITGWRKRSTGPSSMRLLRGDSSR